MKKNITTFLLFLFFTVYINAETIYLTCDGDGEYSAAFRWIQLDKEKESILFTGTWADAEIDEKNYAQKWYEASGYSENFTSISFKFKKNYEFSLDREKLILEENAIGDYPFTNIFKCIINDSYNVQNEHRINYWKGRLGKNKI